MNRPRPPSAPTHSRATAPAPQTHGDLDRLRRAVRKGGGRLTASTASVYRYLAGRQGPVTIDEMAEACRRLLHKPPHMVSLYRIAHRLENLGFVRKVVLGDGVVRYEASSIGHHHHVVCTVCGRIAELERCGMEAMEKYVREVLQFNHLTHNLEYRGVCAECVPARPRV